MVSKNRCFNVGIILNLFAMLIFNQQLPAQEKSADFETVLAQKLANAPKNILVNDKLQLKTGISISEICDLGDSVSRRVFAEYGAMFIGENNVFAGFTQLRTGSKLRFLVNCVFKSEAEVQLYQQNSKPETATIGGVTVVLQKPAMNALLAVIEEARKRIFTSGKAEYRAATPRRSRDWILTGRSRKFWNGKAGVIFSARI
jgi:hypothetical protein